MGKSCLIKKYCEPSRFASSYIPTIGVDYGVNAVKKDLKDGKSVDIMIDLYDLSGEFIQYLFDMELTDPSWLLILSIRRSKLQRSTK